MRILYPLGLLGLIGIILLILIYILKPKYQEKTVSSTFVWKLSLKYKKHKMPFQWLKSSLLFIIQILTILMITIMIIHPLIVLPTKSGEKIVILDASASMLAETNGKTRFERAISDIGKQADLTVPEDKFTVILAANEASYVARRESSADYIKQLLNNQQCTFEKANITSAMKLAEDVLKENPTAEVILYTGRDYKESGNVTVKNMAKSEFNAAIMDFSVAREGGYFVFSAEIASFGKSADIPVVLNVDGKYKGVKLATCESNQTVKIKWDNIKLTSYDNADISIDMADSFAYDNSSYLFGGNKKQFNVQLVSKSDFLRSSLSALGTCNITVTNEENPPELSGYDLYVYENEIPEILPTDGAVWLINPPTAQLETGIELGKQVTGNFKLTSDGGSSDTYKKIMTSINAGAFQLTKYTKVTSYPNFIPLMFCDGDPVLLAKNQDGVKITVMAFDLAFSNAPIILEFPLLIYNLSNYSMQPTVSKYVFNVGERVELHEKSTTTSINVSDGKDTKEFTSFPAGIVATRPGVHTVKQTLKAGTEVSDKFFVKIDSSESDFSKEGGVLINPIGAGAGLDPNVANDTLDIFVFLAAALLLLVLIEWGVQYREQY